MHVVVGVLVVLAVMLLAVVAVVVDHAHSPVVVDEGPPVSMDDPCRFDRWGVKNV